MDDMYNIFLENNHSDFQVKLLIKFNYRVVEYLLNKHFAGNDNVSILELGVGKGYFAKACIDYSNAGSKKIVYSAFDRNKDMLRNLKSVDESIKTYHGELPDIDIKVDKKFDIVYCAFVVEHLKNGEEAYRLINNVRKILNKNGLIVFFTPNVLSQKFEFYNIDYTHQFPTTARNMTMTFKDCGVDEVTCLPINGICTYKNFHNPYIRIIHKAIFSLYSYRMFAILAYPFYRTPLYQLDNFFYRVFCLLKEENLMFIAKNKK